MSGLIRSVDVHHSTDFSDTQRQGVVDAGAYAGLNVLRVMNEPTAAAIGYGLDKRGGEQHVLVYDLGGSTFDVSLLAIDDGHFEIMAATSNLHLGGADFDERVMNHLVKSFRSKSGVDVTTNLDALGKLKREAEQAKHMLSFQELVMIEMGSFADGLDFSETLTRTEFEELNADLFLKTLASVEEVLAEGAEFGVNKGNIDEVGFVSCGLDVREGLTRCSGSLDRRI
jgi:heat shock protein 5